MQRKHRRERIAKNDEYETTGEIPSMESRGFLRCASLAGAILALSPLALSAGFPVLAAGAHASGGICREGREEMQQSRRLYNLQLAFAEAGTGAYLAGITVTIAPTGRGAPLGPYRDWGPLFYASLAPGVHRVVASYEGISRTTTVRIGKGASQLTLYWPTEDAP